MTSNISRQQFAALKMELQVFITNFEGVSLDIEIYSGDSCISLYSLNNFYVELWHHRITRQLQRVTVFCSYKRLDPFLTAINLTSINALLKA